MAKFEFVIEKILPNGEGVWKEMLSIRASGKLEAFAKIRNMFPEPEYKTKFVGTC